MPRPLGAAILLTVALAAPVTAQRGVDFSIDPMRLGRLERLELIFKLDKDQKRAVKTILDTAHKNATGARQALAAARSALGAAVIASKPAEDTDKLAQAYGVAAAAMTKLEMQALGDILKAVTPEQRTAGAGRAFSMLRGVFLDEKKWDVIPEAKGY